MRIIVDAMGGDNAPKAPVMGAIAANKEYGVDIMLVGKTDVILELLRAEGIDTLPDGVEITFASDVVTMEDAPTTILRQHRDSSLVVGAQLLRDGAGDAFVSAGSTGALLTAAQLVVRRIKGIKRAAVAPVIPTETGHCVLIDAGANNECPADYLLQFGFMGSFYAQKYLEIDAPRVGLLNNGSEETKGRQLQKDAYALLKAADGINFVGNVEAKDVMLGRADVVVSDGFTGNILLKSIEGTATFMAHQMKAMFKKNLASKIGYLLCKSGVEDIKKLLNADEVGGTAFLGASAPVIKAHGSSGDYAIKNAIHQAMICVETNVCGEIAANVPAMISTKETEGSE